MNNKINLSSRFSHPFIIIVYKDAGRDDDDDEDDENKEVGNNE